MGVGLVWMELWPSDIAAARRADHLRQVRHQLARAIDHQRIIDTTGGLYELRGYPVGESPAASWSCVVKMLRRSEGLECEAPDSLDDYHRVAVAAGEWAGTSLAQGLPPTEPWLVPGFMRSLLAEGWVWARLLSRDSGECAWQAAGVERSGLRSVPGSPGMRP